MLLQALLILILLAAALFAVNGMRVREVAIASAKQHCTQQGLQLLDQSVSTSKIRLSRNAAGRLTLLRRYTFDFTSTGEERYKGSIAMHGLIVAGVILEPHRMPEQPNTSNPQL